MRVCRGETTSDNQPCSALGATEAKRIDGNDPWPVILVLFIIWSLICCQSRRKFRQVELAKDRFVVRTDGSQPFLLEIGERLLASRLFCFLQFRGCHDDHLIINPEV